MKTKRLFFCTLIIFVLTTSFSYAVSPPSISAIIGKVTMTLSGYRTVNGAELPFFRLHTGDIGITRATNRLHGLTADIYTRSPKSQVWSLTKVVHGKRSVQQKTEKKSFPYPMNFLSEKELNAIEMFFVYADENVNIYLLPLTEKETREVFQKVADLFNKISSS